MISYSTYGLQGKTAQLNRQGALLRFEFEDRSIGFADCHPWEEFGDLPLGRQLSSLAQGALTPLTKRSLAFAKWDAEARTQKKSLFSGLSIPPSHWLIGHIADEIPEDFAFVKLKLGRNPADELPELVKLFRRMPKHTKIRLDFNSLLTRKQFEAYLKTIIAFIDKIDFIEDPFPYQSKEWEEIQGTYNLQLACDHLSHKRLNDKNSHAVTILKPAIQEEDLFQSFPGKLVVTSYLDHPLGQLAAAYVAAKLGSCFPERLEPCGLLSHLVYQTNKYSERFALKNTVLQLPPEGTGFGFDDLLLKEEWQVL